MTPTQAMSVHAIGGGDPLRAPSLLRELEQRYLVWDAFVSGERRVDLHPIVISRALHARAIAVAENVMRSVSIASARAHGDPAERALYGLPESAMRLAEASAFARDDASLVRVDLLVGEDDDLHACEINADCPGGHNESLGLPKLARAAGFSRGNDPTRVVPALAARLADLARSVANGAPPTVGMIYATAYAEDLQVCAIVRRELRRLGVNAILAPPTAPTLNADGALTLRGTPIHALYRYFPAEYMEGQRNVSAIARAVAAGRVRTLSSFAHVYTQSKLSLARAGALANVPETHDLIDVDEARLRAERGDWVVKRAYGRVGEDVVVGALCTQADWELALTSILADRRRGESWIAQRFVRQRAMQTPWGPRLLTLGVYLLDGVFVGYFARITSESHVSHDALVLPVFVESEP
jgi:glutathionylspermidine synthase